MKIAALMLAAGQSKRFNGLKQLADVNGKPMIVHTLSQLTNNGHLLNQLCEFNIVLGENAPQISSILPPYVTSITCTNWQLGMGASLAFGVGEADNEASHLLITLADQVAILHEHIKTMLHYCHKMPEKIIAAQYNNTMGVPVILPRSYFASLMSLNADSGARKIIQQHAKDVVLVNMPVAKYDIDTQSDLVTWRQLADQ